MIDLEKIFSSLGSYNILNYLFPGVVFSFLMKLFFSVDLFYGDGIISLFTFYFYGMTISRVGSLIIEPLLRKTNIIRFSSYNAFLEASKKDNTLSTLSEVNNTYRTIISLFFVLLVYNAYISISSLCNFSASINSYMVIALLLVLYGFSYRKQTQYIRKRVDTITTNSNTMDTSN